MNGWRKLSKIIAGTGASDGDLWVDTKAIKFMKRYIGTPDFTALIMVNDPSNQEIRVTETPEEILGKNLI